MLLTRSQVFYPCQAVGITYATKILTIVSGGKLWYSMVADDWIHALEEIHPCTNSWKKLQVIISVSEFRALLWMRGNGTFLGTKTCHIATSHSWYVESPQLPIDKTAAPPSNSEYFLSGGVRPWQTISSVIQIYWRDNVL